MYIILWHKGQSYKRILTLLWSTELSGILAIPNETIPEPKLTYLTNADTCKRLRASNRSENWIAKKSRKPSFKLTE